MLKVLIVKQEIEAVHNQRKWYGCLENGSVPSGAWAYPDQEGENTLFQVSPAMLGRMTAEEFASSENAIQVDVWSSDEMESLLPRNVAWFVFLEKPVEAARGRRTGFSPLLGEGMAMTQTQIKTSLPQEDLDWLNSQQNKSEVVRKAIALYRQSQ